MIFLCVVVLKINEAYPYFMQKINIENNFYGSPLDHCAHQIQNMPMIDDDHDCEMLNS